MRLPEGDAVDTVIVGGGVYGAMLALEGAARGRRVLLIERDDFGAGSSFNHLRTIHGGLRYLQFLDIPRAIISNRQRVWWLEHFPDLIEPISCLMPLYGEGLRRPFVFRLAFLIARLLGMHRDGTGRGREIGVVSAKQVRSLLRHCRNAGLSGGAIWQDAFMPQSHRVVIELLRWAESCGARVCNRMELLGAERENGRWRLQLHDRISGERGSVTSDQIINASGPGCDGVVERVLGDDAEPVLVRTLAWGLLLDRAPLSRYSVAVAPPEPGSRTYFVHPYHGRMMAGTGHAAIPMGAPTPTGVDEMLVQETLEDLNRAMPGAALTRQDVRHVFHGILPGTEPGSDALLMHPRVVDHGERDASPGFWTVLGVKFTESPFVARRFWDAVAGKRRFELPARPAPARVPSIADAESWSDEELAASVESLAASEWCLDVDDVVWRRTDLWMDRRQTQRLRELASQTANITASRTPVG